MTTKKSSFYFHVIFVIFTIAFIAFPNDQEANQLDNTPLDFSLKTLDGDEISLKDYRREKIVHLLFWATWCPHCLSEMPKIKKLHDAIGNKPYEILAIDVGSDDSLKRIKKIQEQYKIPCKILLDQKGKTLKSCRVFGVPYHIIIDKEGFIKDRFNQLPEDPIKYLNKLFPQKSCKETKH